MIPTRTTEVKRKRGSAAAKAALFTIIFSLFICSCEKQEHEAKPDSVAVQFGSGHIATTRTAVAGDETHWVQDDRIGIFMIEKDATDISGNIKQGADNVEYKADESGSMQSTFSPVGNTLYYPHGGDRVDFIAYYPYTTPLTNYTYPVDVSNQSNPEDIDLLYSNNARDYGKGSPVVDLRFTHALSKLEVEVVSGEGTPSLSGLTITIEGRNQKANLSLSDGISLTGGQTGDIVMREVAAGANYEAILIPQAGVPGSKAVLKVGNDSYDWNLSGVTLERGKKHSYQITVNKTGITVSVGNITDWTGKDSPATEGGASTWKVGDYYPDPNVNLSDPAEKAKIQGVVFWVDPSDGRHGKVVGLTENGSVRWSDSYSTTGATDQSNGLKNMNTIKNLSSDFSGYPVFEWVDNLNSGSESYSDENATGVWYLPVLEELQALYSAYNGYDKSNFNDRLTDAGGTSLSGSWYWSSSESDDKFAYIVSFNDGNFSSGNKNSSDRVRPVLAF